MYGITGAPRVGDGLVFIGNTCMDSGQSRGFVDAFDAGTGARYVKATISKPREARFPICGGWPSK